ncbi:MAG: hypothetical protein HY074_20635 [Deltaproteobacteria bacterium]|nr:hypothetical protein [Deltaproteobacteria bacterium]
MHGLNRFILFTLTVICVLPGAHAASTVPVIDQELLSANLNDKWVVSKTTVTKSAAGTFEGKVFERFASPSEYFDVYMGSIVYFKIPKRSGTGSVVKREEIADNLRKAFNIPHWEIRKQGDAYVYAALWLEAARYVKIFVSEDATSFSASVANFRFSYMESAYVEVELIQRRLAGQSFSNSVPALDRLFSFLGGIFPVAYAGPGCNCAPYDQGCQLACFSGGMSQLDNSINNMTTATNGATAAVNNAANTFGPKIDKANQNAADINKTANRGIDTANNINNTANRGIDEWHRTNDIAQQGVDQMKKLSDPAVIAELAAAATVTTVLAGAAASLLVDGFSEAASAIWEAFTHAKRDKRLVDEFNAARQYYEKYKSQASELEKDIGKMMYFLDASKALRKNREQLLDLPTLLKRRQGQQDKLAELERNKATLIGVQAACVQEYGAAMTSLKELKDEFAGLPPLKACELSLENVRVLAGQLVAPHAMDGDAKKPSTEPKKSQKELAEEKRWAAAAEKCSAARKERVMKKCYGALDGMIGKLKARREAIPANQVACRDAITFEISTYQGMKKEIAADPTPETCARQIDAELALLQSQNDALPAGVAACLKTTNSDVLKIKSESDLLDALEKYQDQLPNEKEFCKTLRSRLNGLKALEWNLMQARSSIIAGLTPVLKNKKDQDTAMNENFQLGVDLGGDAPDVEKKAALEQAMNTDKFYKERRESYMRYCIHYMAPVTHVPIIGGLYLIGDGIASKKGKGIVEQCTKAWTDSDYHKKFIANAKKRYDDAKSATELARSSREYLKANESIIRMDRGAMLDLYKDATMEQVCINGAPTDDEAQAAKSACEKANKLPDDFQEIAYKHKITCKMLIDGKVATCNNAWYHREAKLVGFLDSTSEDITASCGF